jgi:hypothetical protein
MMVKNIFNDDLLDIKLPVSIVEFGYFVEYFLISFLKI